MSAARPETAGKTRTCPHCKATILESLTICPGCLHHLRFDQPAAQRQVAAESALRVEGMITHPPTAADPWEYFVVIAVRNERGEEVTRQVVNVGALHKAETRSFTLSVEVMPAQTLVVPKKASAQPPGPAPRPPASKVPLPRPPAAPAARPGMGTTAPTGIAAKPSTGTTAPAGTAAKSGTGAAPPTGAAAKPLPGAMVPPKR